MEAHHLSYFFTSASAQRRRIVKLIRAGLLYRVASPISDESSVLRLTRRGIYLVEGDYPYPIHQKRQLSPATFIHDGKVTQARLAIERFWRGTWTPESLLLGADKEIPDGIFTFPSGKKVYVELENSLKSKKRFLRRLQNFRAQILVLYITTKPELTSALKKYLLSDKEAPRAGILPFENICSDASPAVWTTAEIIYPFSKKEF